MAAFDRERDNPIAFCQPKGMPTIMEAPYPHRFVLDRRRWMGIEPISRVHRLTGFEDQGNHHICAN